MDDGVRTTILTAQVEALSDPDPFVREKAAEALGEIGCEAGGALPALFAALGDPVAEVRFAAAMAIPPVDCASSDAAVPALVEALGSADADVRGRAAIALAVAGPRAAPAVAALADALCAKSQGPPVEPADDRRAHDAAGRARVLAALALGEIGSAAAPAVPALLSVARGVPGALVDGTPPAPHGIGADRLESAARAAALLALARILRAPPDA